MAGLGADVDIEKQLAALSRNVAGVDPRDIVEVVQSVMASLNGDRSSLNVKLHDDIEALAKYIQAAKAEIAAIKPDEIKSHHIPTATDELSAIVGATEEATHTIFEAVETIEALAETMPPETAEKVTEAVTQVYEACGFQDITGQRVSKVVKVLESVESKVQALLQAFGEDDAEPRADEPVRAAPDSDRGKRSDNDLMQGPQLPDNAISQEDVDALLASFD